MGLLFSKAPAAGSHLVLSTVFILYYFLIDLSASIDKNLLIVGIYPS